MAMAATTVIAIPNITINPGVAGPFVLFADSPSTGTKPASYTTFSDTSLAAAWACRPYPPAPTPPPPRIQCQAFGSAEMLSRLEQLHDPGVLAGRGVE
ncbi:uncharacterized protein GGS25DRAFT_516445 [Hypoxylon fragiforme]|uniref:uncharacterized protein n=1 Tax=Hypoxylon fragiforme TaxID=63214 RepID=UPI0020C6BDD9|nr:uncharacterized protein GGS25DRAFT_516445 [Hypoxylon fragiforme]KAI2613579.1 hypothetical protein GGS25DRAFT_516445 [Hypoxylon fragiforme]